MDKLLLEVLNFLVASGKIDYADVRYRETFTEDIITSNNVLKNYNNHDDRGVGIRVLKDGCWGFASTSKFNDIDSLLKYANIAIEIAKQASYFQNHNSSNRIKLTKLTADQIIREGKYKTPIVIDPFKVTAKDKLNILFAVHENVKNKQGFKRIDGTMKFKKFHQFFYSSEGSRIENEIYLNDVSYTITVVEDGDFQSRTFFGIPKTAGFEWILAQPIVEDSTRLAEEALIKLKASKVTPAKRDLIILPSNLHLTIHESVGHPTELDRVLGWEANFAGTSFATPEKKGNFQYGSDIVNFRADNNLSGGLATIGFDDDGIPSKSFDIIKDGILVGYSTTRETAHLIGESESMGCNRADSYALMPINRIPNLSLMPGKKLLTLEELIADTEDAILIDGRGSFSIDQQRLNFQFGGDFFQEIKNGKIVGPLRDVTYQAISYEFWRSCDAICDQRFWQTHGTLNCGKGEPSQTQHMTHGASPARFRNISVGGA
ncbi:MAG: TldD/PmbA family protein [Oligoflexia bacterium]|nr:TldD/PmbA family protein [Oligoflexia bacterium]